MLSVMHACQSCMLGSAFDASSASYAETSVLANDLKAEGFTVVSLDPGDVSTRMWEYLLQNIYTDASGTQRRQPSLTPQQSVAAMLRLTVRLSTQQSGSFLLYDGQELPW